MSTLTPLLSAPPAERSSNGAARPDGQAEAGDDGPRRLRPAECLFAILVFVFWINLFAGGILIQTKPFRCAISPGGVAALEGGANSCREPGADTGAGAAVAAGDAAPAPSEAQAAKGWLEAWVFGLPPVWAFLLSWLIIIVLFLPINLALICAAAGILGAAGSLANLHDDQATPATSDNSSPYLSALLRGFFVYLFMISGLLLLDDNPFANVNPGQYIRLAGFLSLFSFVVNYQPNLFSTLIVWAFQRIQVRGGEDAARPAVGANVHYRRAITKAVEEATVQTGADPAAEQDQPHPRAAPEPPARESAVTAGRQGAGR